MAISTDTVVNFFGTADILTSVDTSTIGSSLFASTVAVVNWTNDDNAPEANFVFRGNYSTAPAPGASLPLYARLMAVSSAGEDMNVPSTLSKHELIAIFPMSSSTAVQIQSQRAFLPNAEIDQVYQFLLENQGSQTISSGYTLNITPLTVGPSTG